MSQTTHSRNIVFVHPNLGIGGAERLVIDAALGLQSIGHKVTILTSYRDTAHCFEEARDGTLDVRVRGDYLFPASLGNSLSILFSILRQASLVVSTSIFSTELQRLEPDIFIVDQLSACIPLFRLLHPRAQILFYGHYPDRLLVKQEQGFRKQLKALYRIPFDAIEEWSTSCADGIVVNSKYTRSVFRQAFPGLRSKDLKVIYPCVDTTPQSRGDLLWSGSEKVFLSINRFEDKKNLDLAIKAFAGLSPHERAQAKLILAGGYDPHLAENLSCLTRLQELAESLSLSHVTFGSNYTSFSTEAAGDAKVLFLLSVSRGLKQSLLQSSSLLLYTPTNEHFGIVPIEAMLEYVPVLATNTGGPLETIYDGRTGWLRSAEKIDQWTDVMRKPLIPSSAGALKAVGQAGHDRVLSEFSLTKMTASFESEIQSLCDSTGPRSSIISTWFILFSVLALITAAIAAAAGWHAIGSAWLRPDNKHGDFN